MTSSCGTTARPCIACAVTISHSRATCGAPRWPAPNPPSRSRRRSSLVLRLTSPRLRLSNAHIFFGLRSLVETDSLGGVGVWEGGFMSMEVGLGRFGDRLLEKGGRRFMRPSFDVQSPAFDALQGTGPRRFGSRVFCAMKG